MATLFWGMAIGSFFSSHKIRANCIASDGIEVQKTELCKF